MKNFLFDVVIGPENICNLIEDRKYLLERISEGKRIVFYGRRNTGKTSLVKSLIMPKFRDANKKNLVIFADLMGVQNTEQIQTRLQFGFEQGLSQTQPTKNLVKKLATALKGVRPQLSFDPITGAPGFSFGLENNSRSLDIGTLFQQMASYHREYRTLIVMDEFQDVSFAKNAEGLLRNALQNLPGDLPVLILGSKKHLLTKIFSHPDSPLAGWGVYREISPISTNDYHHYIMERFKPHGLRMTIAVTRFLKELVQNIPESVNIVCERILRQYAGKETVITEREVMQSLRTATEEREGFYKERLLRLTEKERRFLAVMAKLEPVLFPNSKSFLKETDLSPGGNRPILLRLESEAVIYRTDAGYVLADPIFANYLRIFH